jgi:hypothetical protein
LRWVTRSGVRWRCSAPIWAAPRPPSAPGQGCARPRAGSRCQPRRPCAATHTAPSWTRPPCSSSTWILRAFASRMTRWSSRHHLGVHPAWRRPNACTATCFLCCGRAPTPLPGTLFKRLSAVQTAVTQVTGGTAADRRPNRLHLTRRGPSAVVHRSRACKRKPTRKRGAGICPNPQGGPPCVWSKTAWSPRAACVPPARP